MAVAHQRQIGLLPFALGLGCRQILGNLGRNGQFMHHAGQQSQLVTTRRTAPLRHHRRSIPTQHGRGLAQRGDAGMAGFQALIGGVHGVLIRLLAQRAKIPVQARARPNQVMA